MRFATKSARTIGALALLGALIGLILTPPMAAVWSYEPGVDWSTMLLVNRVFGPLLESSGLLTFGNSSGDDLLAYEVYGKGFFLVYLLMIPIIRAVRPHRELGVGGRLQSWAWRLLYFGTIVATAGDFSSSWGRSIPGFVGEQVWSLGFLVEILGLLAVLAGTASAAIIGAIRRTLPVLMSVAFFIALASIAPINGFVTAYAPNSVVLPMSLAWAVIGTWHWYADRGSNAPSLPAV